MKEAGVDFISTCIDLNGMKTLAQELRAPGHGRRRALPPEHLQPGVRRRRPATCSRATTSRVQFRPFEADAEGTALARLPRVDGGDGRRADRAGDGRLDQRHPRLRRACWPPGPSSTGTRSSPPPTPSTDFTAGGLIEPIDWTTAHTPYTEDDPADDDAGDECTALVQVDGRRVRDRRRRRTTPWLCWHARRPDWAEPEPTNFG